MDLKCKELKSVKSSVDEPLELELKDLSSHLEYVFLEATNKLPVIIDKNLKDRREGTPHKGFKVSQASNCFRKDSPIIKDGAYTGKKPLISSQLATMDPLGDILVPTTYRAVCFETFRSILTDLKEYIKMDMEVQENPRLYGCKEVKLDAMVMMDCTAVGVKFDGKGPTWLFDLDYLTDSMNYQPGILRKEMNLLQDCFCTANMVPSYSSTITPDLKADAKREGPREEEQVFLVELKRLKRQEKDVNKAAEVLRKEFAQEIENLVIQAGAAKASSTNIFSIVSTPAKASSTNLVNIVSTPVSTTSPHDGLSLSDTTNPEQDDSEIPPLEDIYQNSTDGIFTNSSYDNEGAVADFINLETVVNVSHIPTSRIISSHPSALILGDPTSAVQTRSKVNKSSGAHAFVSYVQKQRRNNHKDFQHCLFACFLSQNEPKKISEALEDESWVDDMQEELL
ncbi:hypothetical protein Tco_0364773 [Tanacetum coccineum]